MDYQDLPWKDKDLLATLEWDLEQIKETLKPYIKKLKELAQSFRVNLSDILLILSLKERKLNLEEISYSIEELKQLKINNEDLLALAIAFKRIEVFRMLDVLTELIRREKRRNNWRMFV